MEKTFNVLEGSTTTACDQNWQDVGVNTGNKHGGGAGICQAGQAKQYVVSDWTMNKEYTESYLSSIHSCTFCFLDPLHQPQFLAPFCFCIGSLLKQNAIIYHFPSDQLQLMNFCSFLHYIHLNFSYFFLPNGSTRYLNPFCQDINLCLLPACFRLPASMLLL
jgi:hypothetical protein